MTTSPGGFILSFVPAAELPAMPPDDPCAVLMEFGYSAG